MTIENIQEAQALIKTISAYSQNKSFAEGDHWQSGRGWVGPMVANTHAHYQTMLAAIKNAFISRNVIGEIVDRHTSGVIGSTPQKHVEVTRPLLEDEDLTPEEEALTSEARARLSAWWGSRSGIKRRAAGLEFCTPHEVFQEAVWYSLLGRRAVLRFVVPNGRDVYIQSPDLSQAAVHVDEETLEKTGVYIYQLNQQEVAEVVFVDGERTIIRTIAGQTPEDRPVEIGGRLTMYQFSRQRELITDAARRLQRALNLTETSKAYNVVQGGYLERAYLNTQMQGTWSDDPNRPGQKVFTASEKMNVGPGTANFLTGLPLFDENGRITGYTTPQVVRSEPSPATPFIEAADSFYHALLSEAAQKHVIVSLLGQTSGELLVQARADYARSLTLTKVALDGALSWCFDTLLALLGNLEGGNQFGGLKISGTAEIDTGPLSLGERQLLLQSYREGAISLDTMLRWFGVDNVSAEVQRIEESLGTLRNRSEVIKILIDAGAGLQPAAVAAGLDDETAATLAATRRLSPLDEIE